MMETSATGGPMLPTASMNSGQDKTLDLIAGDFVASVTGMPRDMIRRRWQKKPPKQPDVKDSATDDNDPDRCAVGVTDTSGDANAYQVHNQTGDGSSTVNRHETVTVLASFYGPNACANAELLRDGATVGQNRAVLQNNGMALRDFSSVRRVPELVNQQFINRADFEIRLRRHVQRTYPIQNVLSSDGTIMDGDMTDTFNTENAE